MCVDAHRRPHGRTDQARFTDHGYGDGHDDARNRPGHGDGCVARNRARCRPCGCNTTAHACDTDRNRTGGALTGGARICDGRCGHSTRDISRAGRNHTRDISRNVTGNCTDARCRSSCCRARNRTRR